MGTTADQDLRSAFNRCGVDYEYVWPNGRIELIAGSTGGYRVGGTVFCFCDSTYTGHVSLHEKLLVELDKSS